MLDRPAKRKTLYIVSALLVLSAIVTWLIPPGSVGTREVPAELLTQLEAAEPEQRPAILTRIYDFLAQTESVSQVLLLQAIPHDVPLVIHTTEDSSGEEEATHWPSPWLAVNRALESGSLAGPITVRGNHHGFRFMHTLIPVDETGSRILLINQVTSARSWTAWQTALFSAGLLLFVALLKTRR